ncbi:MAG: TlpA family protein disulfide reductase [Burkholderiales bacterium]|nr:TlpA family protein disulfide reductase [Burkholderiales bacterium]
MTTNKQADTSQDNPDPTPRRVMLAAAVAATLAGLAVARWRAQDAVPAPNPGAPIDGFWALQWDAPQGGHVRLVDFQGRPLIINFWATWCPPCVEELPLIDAFFMKNKANGWQVIGLAVDKLSAVQAFLQKMPLHFPVGLAGLSGTELGRGLGNLAGGLPFTILLAADGRVIQRKMGKLTPADLDTWAALK